MLMTGLKSGARCNEICSCLVAGSSVRLGGCLGKVRSAGDPVLCRGKPNVEFWSDLENECTKIIQNHSNIIKHPFFKSLNHWTTMIWICLFVYWKQNQGAAVTGTHWEATENDVWWTWGCGWRCQDGADFASCPKNLCVVMSIYVSYVVLQWPCKTMWTSTMLWSSPMRLPNIIVTEPRRISAVSGPCSINAGHPFGFPCAK